MNKKRIPPPQICVTILKRTLPDNERTFLLGDFEEIFGTTCEEKGVIAAYLWYWKQVIKSLPHFAQNNILWSLSMLKNYLKVAVRNLRKQKSFSMINIFGLSLAIACSVLTYFFVMDEFSYDTFHENADQLYIVNAKSAQFTFSSTPGPMALRLKEEFPEIVEGIRLQSTSLMVKSERLVFEENIHFSDPAFFTMLSFELISGNPNEALSGPDKIILTRENARKYFGETNPIGETLSLRIGGTYKDFQVSAVAENMPNNSSIKFGFLVNISRFNEFFANILDNWRSYNFTSLVRYSENNFPAETIQKSNVFIEKYMGSPSEYSIGFIKLRDYHFGTMGTANGLEGQSKKTYSYVLIGITVLVLLIAVFNFMNLSTGRSSSRFKEIGVRRVIGAQKKQLVRQFLFESVFLSFLSLGAAILIAQITLPLFNELAGKSIQLAYLRDFYTLPVLLLSALCIGVLAGGYPALVMSGIKTVDIFKGSMKVGRKNFLTRSLVIVQFTLSVFLIISTMIMNEQQNFMIHSDLGFNKDHVVILPVQYDFRNRERGEIVTQFFKNELRNDQNVISVSGSAFTYGPFYSAITMEKEDRKLTVYTIRVDSDYLETLGIDLLQGRNFDENHVSDNTESVIVNETLMKEFNLKFTDETRFGGFSIRDFRNPKIIGVVKDNHFLPMQRKIQPMVFHINPNTIIRYIHVKISPLNVNQTIGTLRRTWSRIQPPELFQYRFLDEAVENQYKEEQRWSNIVTVASSLAIIIACLGLLGLTTITIMNRTKEIGIRKVLGASPARMVKLLSGELAWMIIVGSIVAFPLAYYVMHEWLHNFAYQISIGIGPFLISGFAVLFAAFLAISIQTVKASLMNPVISLKAE